MPVNVPVACLPHAAFQLAGLASRVLGLARMVGLVVLGLPAAVAATYFVGPDGRDGAGRGDDPSRPWRSLTEAQAKVLPGDTVYFLPGIHRVPATQMDRAALIPKSDPPVSWGYIHEFGKSGTADAPITYAAWTGGAEGEAARVIFDFSDVSPGTEAMRYRVVAFLVSGSHLVLRGFEVTGIQAPTTTGYAFLNLGSDNHYERLVMRQNKGIGFYLLGGSRNLVLNCDAFENYDDVSKKGSGGDSDGFGSHGGRGSVGNVFRGCRAWLNSDDGYDCISSWESVLFENCWAFWNGFGTDFKRLADGNGFKAGGYGGRPADRCPNPAPRNRIIGCIAAGNKANGFYSNHHLDGSTWLHNSAYENGANFNMLNRLRDNVTDVDGFDHVLLNNLSFGARDVVRIDRSRCTLGGNSFDPDFKGPLTGADFRGLEVRELMRPRKADGGLPEVDFLRPKPGGPGVDQGVPVEGRSFNGRAPDVGAFEQ